MREAIINRSFIKNFVAVRQSEDDTGPETMLDGRGLSFSYLKLSTYL